MVLYVTDVCKELAHHSGGVQDFGRYAFICISRRIVLEEQKLEQINGCHLVLRISDPCEVLSNCEIGDLIEGLHWEIDGVSYPINLKELKMYVGYVGNNLADTDLEHKNDNGNQKKVMIWIPWLDKNGQIPSGFLNGDQELQLRVAYHKKGFLCFYVKRFVFQSNY